MSLKTINNTNFYTRIINKEYKKIKNNPYNINIKEL